MEAFLGFILKPFSLVKHAVHGVTKSPNVTVGLVLNINGTEQVLEDVYREFRLRQAFENDPMYQIQRQQKSGNMINNFCQGLFLDVHMTLANYFAYIVIPICLFGIIANVFNVIVFYKLGLDRPTNPTLLAIALADLGIIINYCKLLPN